MAEPKPPRASLHLETLRSVFEQKLENESGVLDLLVAALARGQGQEEMWAGLHAAAVRDGRLAELAFAYERLSREKKLRSLNAAAQAAFFVHAGGFFADAYNDPESAESYLTRAFGHAPGNVAAFERLDALLTARGANAKLGELCAAAAPHRVEIAEQLALFRRAAELAGEENSERAIKIRQEIVRLDPSDASARRVLEGLLEQAGRPADRAKLLEHALTVEALSEEEARAMRMRLATLYAGTLGEPEHALPHLEEVLRTEPTHAAARAMATELLGQKPVAARAAAVLAGAHERNGDPAEMARMLQIEVDTARGTQKRLEAQKRLAALYFERLGDFERAFALDEAIVPSDPADHEARARLLKAGTALDKQLEATRALTRAATSAKDPHVKAQISVELGDVFVQMSEPRKARMAYQAALDVPCDDDALVIHAARSLATLCAEAKDHRAHGAALARLTEIEPEEEARLQATLRLARLAEGDLRDPEGAITAYRALLDTQLEGAALDALGRLYESTESWEDMALLLERHATEVKEREVARGLAFRAAEIRTDKVDDTGAAIDAWNAYIAAFGATREALGRLIPLLEREMRWEELGSAMATDATLVADAHFAPGPVTARASSPPVVDPRSALDTCRAILAIDATDQASRAAVEKLVAEGELRLEAADVLEPIARAEGDWGALVGALEARAELLEASHERLAALEEAAEVTFAELGDVARAIELSAVGLELALDTEIDEVPAWIERIERFSSGSGDAGQVAAPLLHALEGRSIEHPALSLLAQRTGEALVGIGDFAGALEAFQRALAYEPSPDLLARIDELLREQGRSHERIALYRSALEWTEAAEDRRDLFHAIAAVERLDLGDMAAAAATYRSALEEEPDDGDAFAALLEMHEASGDWEAYYAEHLGALERLTGSQRPTAIRRIAELAVERGWLERAAGHYRELLAIDPVEDHGVLAAIDEVGRAKGDAELLRAVLVRRVDSAQNPGEEAVWLERLGELEADRLGRLDRAASSWRRAAESLERAGDVEGARRLCERVLAAAPDDRAAAERLYAIYRSTGAWDRVASAIRVLIRTASSPEEAAATLLAFEPEVARAAAIDRFLSEAEALLAPPRGEALSVEHRSALRAACARVLSADPARRDEASAMYRSILATGDGDVGAMIAAFEAFLRTGGTAAAADWRWLFGFRIGHAVEGARVEMLLEWADLEEKVLGDSVAAAELYERVVALAPEHDAALAARARLLLGKGDTAAALALYSQRREHVEGSAAAALDVEIATLLMERLDRPDEALDTLAPVLLASPTAPVLALVRQALLREPTRARAADLLDHAAEVVDDPGAPAAILELLLEATATVPEFAEARPRWFARLLSEPGRSAEATLEVALRAVGEAPHDAALWDRAEQLARETKQPERVAEAYRNVLGATPPAVPEGDEDDAYVEVELPTWVEGLDVDALEEFGRRAIDYHEEWVGDPDLVIALLRRIVDLLPSSAWAFERLKLTYNLSERWDELFALYDAGIARAESPVVRRELLEDAALAAKDLAGAPARAMAYFEEVLALGDEARIRTALERLYERHGRYRPLVDLLTRQLGALTGEPAQLLRARVARLWLDKIGDPAPAVELLATVVEEEPGRAEAFEMLERALEATTSDVPSAAGARQLAATLLEGHYRRQRRPEELARILAIRLEAATTRAERGERLRAIVRLRLDDLGDEPGAFDAVAELVKLDPTAAEPRAELERLAGKLGRTRQFADVLAAAAEGVDVSLRVGMLAQAASVFGDELDDAERAVALHQAILAVAPERDPAALVAARALDRLLIVHGTVASRGDVLEKLATIEPEPAARRAARIELSRIAWSEDPDRAIRALRAALADDPADADVLDELSRALEERGRFNDLIDVLEQRAARSPAATARRDRVRVAKIFAEQLDDADRAIDAWRDVRERFGDDLESAEALAALLERSGRFRELITLLEFEASAATARDRAADLWRKVGDLHREHTQKWADAVASYELALDQRPGDPRSRQGLEALVARLHTTAPPGEAPPSGGSRAALMAALTLLGKLYAATDDWSRTLALLEPRLSVADGSAAKIALLTEAAKLLESRKIDAAGAFDAIWRAFALAPGEGLAAEVIRLATASERWDRVAAAVGSGFDARVDVPPSVARQLWWNIALWHRDRRNNLAAAEIALEHALQRDPSSIEILEALADAQRRASSTLMGDPESRSPYRSLISTLVRLADANGGDFDLYSEAVEVADGPVGDRALAKTIAEKLLDAAVARWFRPGPKTGGKLFPTPAKAAWWALETLVRLSQNEGPTRIVDLLLRGARLPFETPERRQLRLRAADLADIDVRITIYEELFAEDPNDALASERLDALYREHGRRADLIKLRERQIEVAKVLDWKVALRFELSGLLAEDGDHARAIAVLRENLADAPAHARSVAKFADLLEGGGHHADLVALWEEQAAQADASGNAPDAASMWARAAVLAEARIGDPARAITDYRNAFARGATDSGDALSRLLAERGEDAAAAEVLEVLCEKASPEMLQGFVVRLVDAYMAAGDAAAARARLERYVPLAKDAGMLRDRLMGLYRTAGEWGPLAALIAESASRAPDRATRAARLREAAELHLHRRGDRAAALPLLEEAARLTPDDPWLRRELAAALSAAGRFPEAADALRLLIAAYGTRRPKERALAHFELARALLAAGDRVQAMVELDAALRIDPAHAEILQALARLAREEGQLERATRTYRALLLVVRRPREDGPPSVVSRAEILFELREIARLQGDDERAVEYLESAFEAARESGAERDKLLETLRARRSYDILARLLESRLTAGASGEEAAAILEELATLYDQHLGRAAEAFAARLRALTLVPPSAARLAAALELARRAGQVERFVNEVSRLAEESYEPDRALELLLSLGRALERDAGDERRAVKAYQDAEILLVARADTERVRDVWRALDDIYARLGDTEAEHALLARWVGDAAHADDTRQVADPLYRLAALHLRNPSTQAEGTGLLDRALAADPDPERAESVLREALKNAPGSSLVIRALEHFGRERGRDRALADSLVMAWDHPESSSQPSGAARYEGLKEAMEIALRLDDGVLVEGILHRALDRSVNEGDGALGWALTALAARRLEAGELLEAASLKERAARMAAPAEARALLLEVASLAAGPLDDAKRSARVYEELRSHAPADPEIWRPLADIYRREGDSGRLALLLDKTAPLVESRSERIELRLERARMALPDDEARAVALLEEVLDDDPAQPEAAALLSHIFEKRGSKGDLALLLAKQLGAAEDRRDVSSIIALAQRLGTLREQQGDEPGALAAYRAALDWDARSRDVLRAVVRLRGAHGDAADLGDALAQLLSLEKGEEAAALALQLAHLRVEQGDTAGAIRALEQGQAASPSDEALKDELVRLYTVTEDWRKVAEIHVRDAVLRSTPATQIECLCRAADIFRERLGDAASASDILQRALEIDPSDRDVLLALVDAFGSLGQYDRAVDAITTTLAVQPDDAWLYRSRASLHEAAGRDALALIDLEQAYEKSGGGYAGELVVQIERAIARSPAGLGDERDLRLRLAEVLAKTGDLARARHEIDELTRVDGNDRGALRALAQLEEAEGSWEAAAVAYRRLFQIEEGDALVETALKLAIACEKSDHRADAKAVLERALSIAPGHAGVRERLREIYKLTGSALELATLLIDDAAHAADANARYALLLEAGRLLLEDGSDVARAASVLEQARAIRTDEQEATLLLADAYGAAGRVAEAKALLDAAAALHKGRRSKQLSAIYRRVARLEQTSGDRAAALAALIRAFESDPNNGALAMDLGFLAGDLEDQEVASRAFRAVTMMKIAPSGSADGAESSARGLAYSHLGRLALAQGDRKKARLMLEKALVDDPSLDASRILLEDLRAR